MSLFSNFWILHFCKVESAFSCQKFSEIFFNDIKSWKISSKLHVSSFHLNMHIWKSLSAHAMQRLNSYVRCHPCESMQTLSMRGCLNWGLWQTYRSGHGSRRDIFRHYRGYLSEALLNRSSKYPTWNLFFLSEYILLIVP